MSRIKCALPEKASGKLKELYNGIQQQMGRIPNIFQNLGNSPVVLEAFLKLNEAAEKTNLSPQLREQIALTIAQTNHCQYCLSAHTLIAKNKGLDEHIILEARGGIAHDPKTQAILRFAKQVVEKRGNLSEQDIEALKAGGINDSELVEIMLIININMFTNYFNHITDPNIDFPQSAPLNPKDLKAHSKSSLG